MDKWAVLNKLPDDLKPSVKSAYVFSENGNNLLVITEDYSVYELDLKVTDIFGALHRTKVDKLSGLNIAALSSGLGHVVALTANGTVYTYGKNTKGELGADATSPTFSFEYSGPFLLSSGRDVFVQIATGNYHSLAVTKEGWLYSWGCNEYGQCNKGNSNKKCPIRPVTGDVDFEQGEFKMVTCTGNSSFALTTKGKVYSWGLHSNGVLGVQLDSTAQPQLIPSLQQHKVVKIVGGKNHVLALCSEGNVFAWGKNSFGELGAGTTVDSNIPVEICKEICHVVDIAAHNLCDISAALTKDGKVYMWGKCDGKSILVPNLTPYKEIYDVFAYFATPSVTPQMLNFNVNKESSWVDTDIIRKKVSEAVKLSFDVKENSDLKIVVDKKPIFVHKVILKLQSEHFQRMLDPLWQETDNNEITLSNFSYKAYRAFLYYLYSGEVQVTFDVAIELLNIANMYLEEHLKAKCEMFLQSVMEVENVIEVYLAAITNQSEKLEKICFRFILASLKAVLKSSGFFKLDQPLMRDLMVKIAKEDVFRT